MSVGSHGSLLDLARAAKASAQAPGSRAAVPAEAARRGPPSSSSGPSAGEGRSVGVKAGLAALRGDSRSVAVEFKPVPPPAPAARTGTRVFMAFSKEANDSEAACATKRQLASASKACCTAVAGILCLAVVMLWQGKFIRPLSAAQAGPRKGANTMVSSNVTFPLGSSKSLRTTVSGGDGGIVLGELPTRLCSAPQEDCSTTRCCSDPNLACYVKHSGYAGCRPGCGLGVQSWTELDLDGPGTEQWNCTLLEAASPPALVAAAEPAWGAAARGPRGESVVHGIEPFLLKSVV